MYPNAAGDPGKGSIGVHAEREWGSPESGEEGGQGFRGVLRVRGSPAAWESHETQK